VVSVLNYFFFKLAACDEVKLKERSNTCFTK
jgi:hypothetical protein